MTIPLALLPNQVLEPGNALANLNAFLQTLNSEMTGVLNMQAFTQTTGATATGTAEQILASYTLPGGTLAAANQGVRITARGNYGATANNKTVKLYFGSEVISSSTVAGNATAWEVVMEVYKTAANVQQVNATFIGNNGGTVVQYFAAGAETDTSGILIKMSATDGTSAAGDTVITSLLTELIR